MNNARRDCQDGSDELICQDEQYLCKSSGKCIPISTFCDGRNDCKEADFWDEDPQICCTIFKAFATHNNCDKYDDCAAEKETHSKCKNGRCIPNQLVCDGEDDCGDSSDEIPVLCRSRPCDLKTHFRCKSTGACIENKFVCDGQLMNCPDGTDEDLRMCYSRCNQATHFLCQNGQCIAKGNVCDNRNDCHDGSDENSRMCHSLPCNLTTNSRCRNGACLPNDPKSSCGPLNCRFRLSSLDKWLQWNSECCEEATDFKCPSMTCIGREKICNGVDDCGDRSDEESALCFSLPCNANIRCLNTGRCIARNAICDGKNDCGDHSDEENCQNKICHYQDDFRCPNSGKCLKNGRFNHGERGETVCNGRDDCGDCSDEEPDLCRSFPCDPMTSFRCRTGLCIDKNRVDNYWNNDCLDWSDEPYYRGQQSKTSCRYCNKKISFC